MTKKRDMPMAMDAGTDTEMLTADRPKQRKNMQLPAAPLLLARTAVMYDIRPGMNSAWHSWGGAGWARVVMLYG